jgi:phytanoyl-CoA hydroxylase
MSVTSNPTFSQFGGLWTDRADAPAELERRLAAGLLSAPEAEVIRLWMANGYAVLPEAIAPEQCDAFSAELARMWREGADDVLMQRPGEREGGPIAPGSSPIQNRIVDIHAVRPEAVGLLFAPPLLRFLTLVFDQAPLLFQSLLFECGSEQEIHQDTAYVVVHPPLELVASWIALEDVREGSGELQYYVGSHRLPEHIFGGESKHWDPARHSAEEHGEWLNSLHTKSRALGFPLKTFLANKGDVLLWAADLAHGGAPVQNRSLTRRSLVGHYCPVGDQPHYFTYREDRTTTRPVAGGRFASEYYDLTARAD